MTKSFDLQSWVDDNIEFLSARVVPETSKHLDRRSSFERDRCRIIHSQAFRRLQGKSQIFAPVWTDYLFTRISHSTQVAQIGKALALRFGAKHDTATSIVEAACLAHDLGHPPFGHVGESALHDMMKQQEYGGFEGNAQTFRILTRLEKRDDGKPQGLNLCRGTLLSVIKYPYYRSREQGKFLYELDLRETAGTAETLESWLLRGTGHSFDTTGTGHRTIVCSIMDWADDVAYSVHDLQDGFESYFLQPLFIGQKQIIEKVQKSLAEQGKSIADNKVHDVLKELAKRTEYCGPGPKYKSYTKVLSSYINDLVTRVNVRATGNQFPFDYALDTSRVREKCDILKALTRAVIVNDVRATTFAAKGRAVVERLFALLMENARLSVFPRSDSDVRGVERSYKPSLFREHMRQELESLRSDLVSPDHADPTHDARCARIVCDFIASLTDGQAISLYERLTDPKEGHPLTFGL